MLLTAFGEDFEWNSCADGCEGMISGCGDVQADASLWKMEGKVDRGRIWTGKVDRSGILPGRMWRQGARLWGCASRCFLVKDVGEFDGVTHTDRKSGPLWFHTRPGLMSGYSPEKTGWRTIFEDDCPRTVTYSVPFRTECYTYSVSELRQIQRTVS
jgi:hypothetical protein